ncbi:hypothetical protein SLA2020_503150 [Shorea laevis]
MDMKKISCAVLFAAACMTAALASYDDEHQAHVTYLAPAPAPFSSAPAATLPVLGSVVGASLVSLVAYYLQ